jgi:hypothetical protein
MRAGLMPRAVGLLHETGVETPEDLVAPEYDRLLSRRRGGVPAQGSRVRAFRDHAPTDTRRTPMLAPAPGTRQQRQGRNRAIEALRSKESERDVAAWREGSSGWRTAIVTGHKLAPMALHLFAGVRVRDFRAARPWYEQLLGEPTFFPHATEAVWTLAEDRSVYLVEHAHGAGKSVATIFLDDLDSQVAAIAARGLEPDEQEALSNGVRKAIYRDSDGNELVFAGAPLDTGLQT